MSATRLGIAPILAISFTLLWSAGEISAVGSSEQQFERILAKSNRVLPPPYRALRRLEGGLTESDKRAWMEVWTQYQPGHGFSYEIVDEGGHDYVRDRVLRHMLDSEQELIAEGKRLHASLDANNYAFEDGGMIPIGLQRIFLKPVKKSDGIVNGTLLLDPDTGFVTQIRGRLVKNPSFWVRDVDVTWKFASIDGYNVPIEMTSTARVRMFGRSNFRMTYEYASIDGRPMSGRIRASLQER